MENIIYAAPKNKSEYILLLDEAIKLADKLNNQLDCIGNVIENNEMLLAA